ncbi:MAG: glutamate-5-semialdehyde dehydrogenase [Elusimicrobium sp.]|jgi:glutamate-5-semialdehyde dehydrogenase|nr:glutamate-5-semialdehyde dehydrogenase [Elusimicrobium sp.]
MDIKEQVRELAAAAKNAFPVLAAAPRAQKDAALNFAAEEILKNKQKILEANERDLKSLTCSVPAPARERMTLTDTRVDAMADGLKQIAALEDPVGKILKSWTAPAGFKIEKASVPLGLLCVIYESRPNVTADAAALCIKSGNTVILRGGADAFNSSYAIWQCLREGLKKAGLPPECAQMVPSKSRDAVGELLKLDGLIDVIIPRGGKNLIERVSAETRIPTFKHLNGICHTFVEKNADIDMAAKVVVNAKMRRVSICGATETMLLDKTLPAGGAKKIVAALISAGCEVRGDAFVQTLNSEVKPAAEQDFGAEFLDAVISAKQVDGVKGAAEHIAKYGSSHTESIITGDAAAAEEFLNSVDSAVVMHNASTQFCDGGEFGFGGEIGIATGRLHARGPVALEQLVTFKYKVKGNGHTRK